MKKGQSLIIQFALFFLLGFSLFITIGSFFKSQSESFRSESIEYNTKLANSYLSAFAIVLVDNCKNCDQASVLIKLENTTAGYFFEEKLSSLGLNISAPGTPQSFTSSIHNLNCSTDFFGRASSAKPIYLTFNRSQNVLYLGELGITLPSTTTTSSTTTSSTTTTQGSTTTSSTTTTLPPWSYRKPVTISNSLSTLTDYQVLVTTGTASLISAGKMRSDCGDIRFRDSDGTTDLNYWIESGCNSGSTIMWIKVPSVPSGTKTIYMYYGNASASTESNGANTFLIFDNFEGTFTWTYEETHANFEGALDSSTYVSPTKSYRLGTDGTYVAVGTGYAQIKKNAVEGNVNVKIRFNLRRSTTYTTGGWAENSVWFGATRAWNQDVYPATTSFSTYEATGTLPASGQVSLRVQGLQTDTYAYWYHGGYWDNVIVRKYSSPEPTTSVGTEEKL